MPAVLAIDIGRSGCRASLWDDDTATPEASASGDGSLGLGSNQGPAVAEAAILAVVEPMLIDRRIDCVGVGIAGAMAAPEAARELARRLLVSLSANSVSVMSDAISSHAGALGGHAGVVLAAGTGAVALAIGDAGRFRRVDGRGPWIGDEGSGAWLGRKGVQAVAHADDGRGPATSLSASMHQQFGSLDQLSNRLGSDPNPARTLAQFAPTVAAAAAAGDAVAMALIEACAHALAESVIAAASTLEATTPVAATIVGGLVKVGPVLLEPLQAVLAHGTTAITLQPALGTSLDGARQLATSDGGIHAAWITRVHA